MIVIDDGTGKIQASFDGPVETEIGRGCQSNWNNDDYRWWSGNSGRNAPMHGKLDIDVFKKLSSIK